MFQCLMVLMKECLCLSLFLHLHFSNFLSFCFELVLLFVPSIVCTTISSSRLIIINLDGSSAVVYCCTSINVLCMFFHSGTSVSMLFMATQWCADKLLLFCFVLFCYVFARLQNCGAEFVWIIVCLIFPLLLLLLLLIYLFLYLHCFYKHH